MSEFKKFQREAAILYESEEYQTIMKILTNMNLEISIALKEHTDALVATKDNCYDDIQNNVISHLASMVGRILYYFEYSYYDLGDIILREGKKNKKLQRGI